MYRSGTTQHPPESSIKSGTNSPPEDHQMINSKFDVEQSKYSHRLTSELGMLALERFLACMQITRLCYPG